MDAKNMTYDGKKKQKNQQGLTQSYEVDFHSETR